MWWWGLRKKIDSAVAAGDSEQLLGYAEKAIGAFGEERVIEYLRGVSDAEPGVIRVAIACMRGVDASHEAAGDIAAAIRSVRRGTVSVPSSSGAGHHHPSKDGPVAQPPVPSDALPSTATQDDSDSDSDTASVRSLDTRLADEQHHLWSDHDPDQFDLYFAGIEHAEKMAQCQRMRKQGQTAAGGPLGWDEWYRLKRQSIAGQGEKHFQHMAQDETRRLYALYQEKVAESRRARRDFDEGRSATPPDEVAEYSEARLAAVAAQWKELFAPEYNGAELEGDRHLPAKRLAPWSPDALAEVLLSRAECPRPDTTLGGSVVEPHLGHLSGASEMPPPVSQPQLNPRLQRWVGELSLEQTFEQQVVNQQDVRQVQVERQEIVEAFQQQVGVEQMLTDQTEVIEMGRTIRALRGVDPDSLQLDPNARNARLNTNYGPAELWLYQLRKAVNVSNGLCDFWRDTEEDNVPEGAYPLVVSQAAAGILLNCRASMENVPRHIEEILESVPVGLTLVRNDEERRFELRLDEQARDRRQSEDARLNLFSQEQGVGDAGRKDFETCAAAYDARIAELADGGRPLSCPPPRSIYDYTTHARGQTAMPEGDDVDDDVDRLINAASPEGQQVRLSRPNREFLRQLYEAEQRKPWGPHLDSYGSVFANVWRVIHDVAHSRTPVQAQLVNEIVSLFAVQYERFEAHVSDSQAQEAEHRQPSRTLLNNLSGLAAVISRRVGDGMLHSAEFYQYVQAFARLSAPEFSLLCETLRSVLYTSYVEESKGTRKESRFFELSEKFFIVKEAAEGVGLSAEDLHEDPKTLWHPYSLEGLSARLECCRLAQDPTQKDFLMAMPSPMHLLRRLLSSGFRFVHRDMWLDFEPGSYFLNHSQFSEIQASRREPLSGAVKPLTVRQAKAHFLRFMANQTQVNLAEVLAYWDEKCPPGPMQRIIPVPSDDPIDPAQWRVIKADALAWADDWGLATESSHHQDPAVEMEGDEDQLRGRSSYADRHINELLIELGLGAESADQLRENLRELNQHNITYAEMDGEDFALQVETIRGGRSLPEQLAILREAVYRLSGQKQIWLRVEQCAAILLACQGHAVLQMETSEGKTKVIQMVALLRALAGQKVDVLTHNAKLAEDGAAGIQKLAGFLGLTVADREAGLAEEVDIFYTDISRAVTDDLQARYEGRAGRQADVVLLDEGDNTQVDVAAKTTVKLSVAAQSGGRSTQEQHTSEFSVFLVRLNAWVATPGDELPDDADGQFAALCASLQEDAYFQGLDEGERREWLRAAASAASVHRDQDYVLARDGDGRLHVRIMHHETTGRQDKKSQWSAGVHQLVAARERERLRHEGQGDDAVAVPPLTEAVLEGHVTTYVQRYGQRVVLTGTLGDEATTVRLQRIAGGDDLQTGPAVPDPTAEENEEAPPADEVIVFPRAIKLPRARRAVVEAEVARLVEPEEEPPQELEDDFVLVSPSAKQKQQEPSVQLGAPYWPLEPRLPQEGLDHGQPQPMGFFGHIWYSIRMFFASLWAPKPAEPLVGEPLEDARRGRRQELHEKLKVRHSRRYDFPAQFFASAEEHRGKVVEAVHGAREKGLSAIVFLNTIEECNQYRDLLITNGVDVTDIQILDDIEDEQSGRPPEQMIIDLASHPRRVTLATAAGGRGTDFLGVDVGILAKPDLQRVQQQKMGRVGRNGQLATTYQFYHAADFGYEESARPAPIPAPEQSTWEKAFSCCRAQPDEEEVRASQARVGAWEEAGWFQHDARQQLEAWQVRRQQADLARAKRHDRLHLFKDALQQQYLEARGQEAGCCSEEQWQRFFSQADKHWDSEEEPQVQAERLFQERIVSA